MGMYDNVECTLVTCALHDDVKHGCDQQDAFEKIKNRLKTRHHIFHDSSFVVQHAIKSASVWDVVSKAAEAMVAEITVHTTVNVVDLFVQSLVL